MPVEVREGALVLELDSDRCLKWDNHDAFTKGIARLGTTKAVDVCATVTGAGAVFLELKDFRAARIENEKRVTSGELAREIADKVRDSLAGLVWASKRQLGEVFHEQLTRDFLRQAKAFVVLWLETDHLDIAGASALQDAIRNELKPHIEAKVIVTSSLLEKQTALPLAWLRVRGVASQRLAARQRTSKRKGR
jgi:hypothetical protein